MLISLMLRLWKPLALFALIIIVHAFVFKQGVNSCEEKHKIAEAKEIILQQQQAAQKQRELDASAAALAAQLNKQREYSKTLEGKLNAERKKRVYSTCVVPVDGVRLRNAALKD